MNNSRVFLDRNEDEASLLERNYGEFAQIVEALSRVEASDDWQKLKSFIFDDLVENLERKLISEASKKELDVAEVYRIQGQLTWAKKYADLKKLSDVYRQQTKNIKNQINEQKNPRDGAL